MDKGKDIAIDDRDNEGNEKELSSDVNSVDGIHFDYSDEENVCNQDDGFGYVEVLIPPIPNAPNTPKKGNLPFWELLILIHLLLVLILVIYISFLEEANRKDPRKMSCNYSNCSTISNTN